MPKLYHENDQWLVPGTQSRKALRVDLPNQPHALAEWLNERVVSPTIVETDRLSEEEFAEVVEVKERTDFAPPVVKTTTPKTADGIIDFILDEATVDQCANILSCIGTRFGELIKQKKGN